MPLRLRFFDNSGKQGVFHYDSLKRGTAITRSGSKKSRPAAPSERCGSAHAPEARAKRHAAPFSRRSAGF